MIVELNKNTTSLGKQDGHSVRLEKPTLRHTGNNMVKLIKRQEQVDKNQDR